MCCNIPGAGLDPTDFEDVIHGCTCSVSCEADTTAVTQSDNLQTGQSLSCTCLRRLGHVYDENGCLTSLSRDNPNLLPLLTECNSRCSCSYTCKNRTVQKGIRYKLEVFKHVQKGLCLRTLESIKELTFICEYAGEVISQEEAKHRALQQTDKDMNYIFVLNEHFASGPLVTCVDPCKLGNIGRFLNHSCEPNAFIIPIRVENMVPKLCVFALRDISSGEEITYDYGSNNTENMHDVQTGTSSEETFPGHTCHCLSDNCKGFLPFDSTIFRWNTCTCTSRFILKPLCAIVNSSNIFSRKLDLIIHVNRLLGRRFTWIIKPNFIEKNINRMTSIQFWMALYGLTYHKTNKYLYQPSRHNKNNNNNNNNDNKQSWYSLYM